MHDDQTPPWQIKIANLHDAGDLSALKTLMSASAKEAGVARLDCSAFLRALQSHASAFALLLYACEQDAKPLAMCLNYLGFSAFAASPTIRVHEIFVLPSHRRLGLARALLAAVESSARSIGAASLQLERRLGTVAEIDEIVTRLGFSAAWDKCLAAPTAGKKATLTAGKRAAKTAAPDIAPAETAPAEPLPETAPETEQAPDAKKTRRRKKSKSATPAKDAPAVVAGMAFEDFSEQIQALAPIIDPVIPTKAKARRLPYARRRRQNKPDAAAQD